MSVQEPKRQMVINYVPGEECRVAVAHDGKLEEFHAERNDAVSHVGNIYVGKVVNVEPAIQAAFIDFGLEANGFLHVSDLHPQYFPGEGDETTERVGKKTPRRDRPPIQECLRRGQEIAVQVLKEGVGTKGPTVTSYLSIPGRFLVMMPQMDRVGVSRKVEDEETRRKMREILDQLELPEGFGFILRTAGMERTKAELKRDLAYLQRLWKDMERRWSKGSKPRLLYSESDLLVRALRDMLTTEIDRIVIDDETAIVRAARFLKIVAPRSSTTLVRYTGKAPIFHAMGIEPQIRTIFAREVPLPGGGRLVIDETEALVAIDVNSGKMRDARDAETNAYRTNMEAADEICRQLRLRDLGGIVINDLIDMRSLKHRREIEQRFKDNLKNDRARTTLETISDFGILEMTRQRMRGSHESVHFADCPICRGRGLVQKPDSVAADAMRELATLLDHGRVARVEMVVSPRIGGELLSSKRRSLNRLERQSGKHVDVRISEAVPVDRVTFYAYDERGADIEVGKIGPPTVTDDQLQVYDYAPATDENWAVDPDREAEAAKAAEPAEPEPTVEIADSLLDTIEVGDEAGWVKEPARAGGGGGQDGQEGQGRRRRRRRRGRGGRPEQADGASERAAQPAAAGGVSDATDAPSPESRPGADGRPETEGAGQPGQPGQQQQEGEGGRRRRRRRRRRGGGGDQGPAQGTPPAGMGGLPADSLRAAMGENERILLPGSSWDLDPQEVVPVAPREDAQELTGAAQAAAEPPFESEEPRGGEPQADSPPHHDDRPPGPMDQPGGDNGQRRRRRRRRRGRGGQGQQQQQPSQQQDGRGGQHGGQEPVAPPDQTPSHTNEGEPRGDEPVPADGGPGGPNGGQEQGGRRRRRRRRGGRGGGGGAGGGGGGAGQSGGGGGGGRARGDRHGGDRHGGGPPHADRPQQARPPQPPPAPPQSGGPGEAKPKRVLYATRRKLAPSEVLKLKPQE